MPTCQIEYVTSDSNVGMVCGKPAITKCSDCVQSTLTASWSAAGIHFVNCAMTTTQGFPA
jgi:hypothetical protein